jgi:RNA polymerase sigma-70 factor (ECF subfamily)
MNLTRSRAIDRMRFDHRKKRRAPNEIEPADTSRRPEEEVGPAEQALRLRNALSVLTREERQAIESTFFAEDTYAEAARKLDEPLGTIKTRIRSALEKLRLCLDIEDDRA